MPWFLRMRMLLEEKKEADAGGAGGDKKEAPAGDKAPTADIATVLARLERLEAENKSLKEKGAPGTSDLAEKVRLEREAQDKGNKESKRMEHALAFNMTSKEWVKTNETLLPNNIAGIIDAAEKQNYGSAVEKANAIKSGIVQEYFAQQANLDLLTQSQKTTLADFFKLTKNEKENRVPEIYDSIFEPAFEANKRMLKAQQLAKGHGSPSDAQAAHREKMIAVSKKQYLREGK